MNGNPVTVIKDGKLTNTDEDNLNPDDLVVLQVGEIVPADLKLIEARGLEIDEFEITGEIMPVIKEVGDQDGLIYKGSRVVQGAGKGLVIATGQQTEYGWVLNQEWEHNKPYKPRIIEKKYLVLVGFILPAFAIHLALFNNAIAVIIGYIFLSLVLLLLANDDLYKYLLLSNVIKSWRRSNIQIQDPKSLADMNEIDLICFDKTGVLTTRKMGVKNLYFSDERLDAEHVFDALEESTAHLVKIASALCNDVFFFEKMELANPIDKALISFAQKNGINGNELSRQSERIYTKPFDSENRYMVSGFKMDRKEYYFAKGDPGVVLSMCNRYRTAAGEEKKLILFRVCQNVTLPKRVPDQASTTTRALHRNGWGWAQ